MVYDKSKDSDDEDNDDKDDDSDSDVTLHPITTALLHDYHLRQMQD
jgi:hypothetical protein